MTESVVPLGVQQAEIRTDSQRITTVVVSELKQACHANTKYDCQHNTVWFLLCVYSVHTTLIASIMVLSWLINMIYYFIIREA